MWHTKMHFSAKCNSGRIAIQWYHIKHYLDYQYTKFQPYTFRVQKMCVFARYATLVPRLYMFLIFCYKGEINLNLGAQWLSGRVLDSSTKGVGSSLTSVTALCP